MRNGSTALEKAIIEKLRSVKKPKWLGELAGARTGLTYWAERSVEREHKRILRGPMSIELRITWQTVHCIA